MNSPTPEPQRGASLDQLVVEVLGRVEDEGLGALDEVCRAHPEEAAQLRRRVQRLLEAGLIESDGATTLPFPERLGDFRLVEPIGSGGMGVVYLAVQESLDREVALKLVRPDQVYFPGARSRFHREVAIVAGLQHPGIVPVYAVGEEQGIPFFAMERVAGATLGDVLDHLGAAQARPDELTGADLDRALRELTGDDEERAASELSGLFQGSWVETCLRLAREVAEALEHAHRRGVLHRDVKPSNVMVTRKGRVLLVDFGLSSAQSADRITRSATRVGSLPYMSPEQIEEEQDELDERTDVYSLGVSLYELLTLRLPFSEPSRARLADSIRRGAPEPAQRRNAHVSWEVETVLQTAMSPDRADRYASAADFARDLGNVLAARPIEARRASVGRRLVRWVQRNPTLSVAVGLGFVLVVGGPSALAWQQHRANVQVSGALATAEEQRDAARLAQERAELNFERAVRAVEAMLGRVGGDLLQNVPQVQRIRRELLMDAVGLYEEFLAERGDDPSVLRQCASTLGRLAVIRTWLEEYDAAEEAIRDQQRLLAELLETAPEDRRRIRFDLAKSWRLLATVHRERLAYADARDATERCLDLLGELDDRAPAEELLMAEARVELGEIEHFGGRPDEARAALSIAADELRAYLERDPTSRRARELLGMALESLSSPERIFRSEDRSADYQRELEGYVREAIAIREELAREHPDEPEIVKGLADSRASLATSYASTGRLAEAEPLFRAALAAYQRLHADFPSMPHYAESIGDASMNLGNIASAHGAPLDERERWFEDGHRRFRDLHERFPNNRFYGEKHMIALFQLAQIMLERGDPDPAFRPTLERTVEEARDLRARGLLSPATYVVVRICLAQLAVEYADLGRCGDARDLIGELLDLGPHPTELVTALRAIGLCLSALRADPAAAGPVEVGELEDLALALVRDAAPGWGPTELAELRDRPGLDGLGDVPGFVELCRDLGIDAALGLDELR